MSKKIKLPRAGQFIVIERKDLAFPIVDMEFGLVDNADYNDQPSRGIRASVYFSREHEAFKLASKSSDIYWAHFNGNYKVIPKYAIKGFIAMRQKANENSSNL